MGNSFHNTLNFSGDDLKRENAKAKKQEDLILAIFKANPSLKISPSMIHTAIAKKYNLYPPLTSVRRAITNLCGQLELIKTGEMVPGLYHLPENTWRLNCTSETLPSYHQKTSETPKEQPFQRVQGDLFDM